ncbi:P-loop containing nucleoside triphosphate hydrolase protein [Lentinula boryana]|uniref:P-loop containing nucleoside triphosphate hydrolase protein n=1 Tax=Lentinula boryana TaxID=40481 RepID=A0ABQ8QQB6_9AGAR|nr:P-loop containing nucleoside triphosphate hydrolase protein [Lentinula boryana]
MPFLKLPARKGTTTTTTTGISRRAGSGSSSQSFAAIPAISRVSSSPGNTTGSVSDQNEVANSDYAKKCKALMELYRALLSLGADMFFDLPQIAVIGAQSAGKSSLIEAISGINVPRDSGICTRCPVQLSMSSFVEEWKCSIALRIEYDPSGQQQGNSTLIDFCTLSFNDRTNVDLWLRRAQASILWRERPVSDFQNMSLIELKRLKPGEGSMLAFSMNVIQVRLEDPEATDLTFIDLPGLIQNASENEIAIAHNLVEKNIQGAETLVLVTIPMSDEMENQESARLAKQADPSGIRTIGVLTKPDTITRGAIGARERWKDILQGKLYPLHHGYYCVRLADDEERAKRLSRSASEALSSEFFQKTDPWSGFVDRSRFGVPNFVKDISRLLLGMIEANLPKLRIAVDQMIQECSEELEAMPVVPTSEPSTEILLRVSDFCREVKRAVMGEDHKFLVHDNQRHYQAFKAAIERTNPDFWPFNYGSNPGLHVRGGTVGPFDLGDVLKEIAEALTWELPGTVPFDAIKNIVLKSTTNWPASTNKCFDAVFQSTRSAIEVLVNSHFKQFSKLETCIKTLSYSELDACRAKALILIQKLLSHESVPLYTQNIQYFATEKSKWLSEYTKVHRRSPNYPSSRSSSPEPIIKSSYDDALSVMATVSAYFQVASKRFVDHIPLAIEHELNQLFATNIHQRLLDNIMSGSDVPGRMQDLLSEDEDITAKREFLKQRLARLREIQERLSEFSI